MYVDLLDTEGAEGMTEFTRPQVLQGLAAEYTAFADLVESLGDAEWSTATRCTGWQVRDVAGHVAGNATDSADGSIGRHTPDEQARSFRDGTPAQVATAVRHGATRLHSFLGRLDDATWDAPSPVPGRTISNGVLTLWYDAFVHGDDIRTALGRPARLGPGLAASLRFLCEELARLGWGPATLALDGFPPYAIGIDGPVIGGDPMGFVLAASGRCDPAELGLDEDVNVHALR
jgi:uncharacterized protein (TIGR03083 family)